MSQPAAKSPDPKKPVSKGGGGGAGAPAKGGPPSLKQVWPIPAFVLSAVLLLGGLVMVVVSQPKPDPSRPLEKAKQLVEQNKFDEAIAYMNTDVLPMMDHGQPTDAMRRDFFVTRARAFFGAQRAMGISREENNRVVIDDYDRYEKLGGELESGDLIRLAETQLAMDNADGPGGALELARKLPEKEAARRSKLYRQVVEHNLEHSAHGRDPERERRTLELLATMANAPAVTEEDSAWVLARQAELLIRAGAPEQAAEKIVRRLGKLGELTGRQQGELRLLLGKAYFQTEENADAGKHLEAALEYLPEGDPLRAEAGAMLGRLAQARGELEKAQEYYEQVRRDHGQSPAVARAILGLAEVHAAARDDQDQQQQSAELYAELVEKLAREGSGGKGEGKDTGGYIGDVSRGLVTESLLRRFTERYDSGRKVDALRFAMLGESLYKSDEVPASVLLAIGRTRRDLADELMDQAREHMGAEFSVLDLDQTTRAEVKQHYMAAGDYLRKHAHATVVEDGVMSGDSLWLSADSYDRGGDLDEAKSAFAQYADGSADNDAKKPEAKYRLAQVFQAMKDYGAAASLYEELVQTRSTAGSGDGMQAGLWGERSIVPLASCLIEEGTDSKRKRADELLRAVVDGSVLSPDAAGYRDALIELGKLYYTGGRYAEAITRFEQAVERYPEDRRIEIVRFRLADANRLEAAAIKRTLEGGAMPQSQVEELTQARQERLRSAKLQFEQVRAGLEGRDRKKLSALDRTYLRNAQFYAGDCAFELGDYDGAIQAYDAARLKYSDEPSSLVAMVQIVSAYVAQGKVGEARTANERARQHLAKFPEEIWSNPDLPMERKHWERWLDARTQLEAVGIGQ